MLPGATKGSFATVQSPPQCHAAFGTMPHNLALVDQSPVCGLRILPPFCDDTGVGFWMRTKEVTGTCRHSWRWRERHTFGKAFVRSQWLNTWAVARPKRRILGHDRKILEAGVSFILMILIICTLHHIILRILWWSNEGACYEQRMWHVWESCELHIKF
jgi:hypothetical protein